MLSYVARTSNLSHTTKATTQAVASAVKPVIPGISIASDKFLVQPPVQKFTKDSLAASLPTQALRASASIGGSFQVRYAHTDLQVPDFSPYRRADVQDSRADTAESAPARRLFSYVIVGSGGVAGVYAAKSVVSEFVSSMSASADVLALAKIEVKLGDIPEGKNMTFKWRGKPLFIRHRTPTEIETEKSVDLASLRDPQADAERATRPEWLVVLGVCTHLGCVPIANAGDFGGYYCPCHGSHYDASGRIRKGPAPLNLEVPTHSYVDDSTLIVG